MIVGLFFLVVIILDCPLAFADNCGSLYDCFGTMQSATGVGVGIAVMMVVGWLINLFPKVETAKPEEQGEPGLQSGDRTFWMRMGEIWRGNDVRAMIERYGEHIDAVAREFEIDADLIRGIIFEEQTHLDPYETDRENFGAGRTLGLGQITEGLHGFTREQLLDPTTNIRAIGTHLASLQAQRLIDPNAPIASLASRYNCGTCALVTPYGRRVVFYRFHFRSNH